MAERIRIAAVGDILMWRRQVASGKVAGANRYDFDPMFRHVAPYLRSANLTIGNLETTLSGRESQYQQKNPRNGYPMFNCPDELADSLKRSGLNVLTTANNHCMDRGVNGLVRTLRVLDGRGLAHTGTARTSAEANRLLVVNVKGVKVGVLSYTYGTNGIPVPKTHLVNRINVARMIHDVKRMRKSADFVIVAVHFGQEFKRYPNQRQRDIVSQLWWHGADLVLGCHPHVLQPIEVKKVKEVTGETAPKAVIYSLGNFVSDKMLGNFHSDCGVILQIDVVKGTGRRAFIQRVGYLPTWVRRRQVNGLTTFAVVPASPTWKGGLDLTRPERALQSRAWTSTTGHLGKARVVRG